MGAIARVVCLVTTRVSAHALPSCFLRCQREAIPQCLPSVCELASRGMLGSGMRDVCSTKQVCTGVNRPLASELRAQLVWIETKRKVSSRCKCSSCSLILRHKLAEDLWTFEVFP